MMKISFFFLSLLLFNWSLGAQNPIKQSGVYLADPVWKNRKL